MDAAEEKKLLHDIALRLRGRHDLVPPRVVESVVGAAYANFDKVPVRDYPCLSNEEPQHNSPNLPIPDPTPAR